jgi:hypothetical protein
VRDGGAGWPIGANMEIEEQAHLLGFWRISDSCLADPPPRWCWRLIWEDVDLAAGVIHVRAQRWLLFCCDRNERCWPYDDIGPSVSVDPLLAEIDADPTEIFRG